MLLLLRILAPQLLALAVYAIARAAGHRRDPAVAQVFAIAMAGASAWWLGMVSIGGMHLDAWPRVGAFVALEVFVALLGQLLILAAQNE